MDDVSAPCHSVSELLAQAVDDGSGLTLSLDQSWLQGRSWFGGMQMALAMKAARRYGESEAPIRSVHASFIAPVLHGAPVRATAHALRKGRSATQIRASLDQGEQRCFDCTAILGADRPSEMAHDARSATKSSPERALRFDYRPGVIPNFVQHYDMRWASGRPPFSGATDPTATIFARPIAEHVRYDESAFIALTDVIPPPILSVMRTPAPASSMNCALELIAPQAVYGSRQWIRFETEVHDARYGYAWQSSRLYAEDGTLLAVAHQAVAVFS